jgi:hypothetical protein
MGNEFCIEGVSLDAILGKAGAFIRNQSGTVGVPRWGDLVAYFDAGDRASLPPDAGSPPSKIYDVAHNVAQGAIRMADAPPVVDSHLSYTANVIILDGNRPTNTFNLFGGNGGGMTFWVRVRSTAVSGRLIDTRGGSNNQGYYLTCRGANPTGFQLEFGRTYSIQNGVWRIDLDALEDAVPLDTWVHIGLVFQDQNGDGNPGTVAPPTMTVNGVQAGTVVESTVPDGVPVAETTAFIRIGGRGTGGSNALDGDMDVVRMWSEPLTVGELAQDYQASKPRFQGLGGLQLIDHAVALAPTTQLTLNGADSGRDATLVVIGRIFRVALQFVGELRPVPGGALSGIDGKVSLNTVFTAASGYTSTTGWPVAGALGTDGGASLSNYFVAFIWPKQNGVSVGAYRLLRSIGLSGESAGLRENDAWGRWTTSDNDDNFESITFDSIGGLQFDAGSELYLYRIGGGDPQ